MPCRHVDGADIIVGLVDIWKRQRLCLPVAHVVEVGEMVRG